jgi:hypothetical protein
MDQDDIVLKGENLMISHDYCYKESKFSMDGDRIFFWDGYEIQFYDLKKSFKPSNM